MAKSVLVRSGLALSWHPTRVRFGVNTIKPMKQESEPGVVLQENDIFFIDIAPRLVHLAGLELATGVNLNIVAPEQAAAVLREA